MKLKAYLHITGISKQDFSKITRIKMDDVNKCLECRASDEIADRVAIATHGTVSARDCVTDAPRRKPGRCDGDIVIRADLWQRDDISSDALILHARSAHCRDIDAVNDLGWSIERYEIALAELRACGVRLRKRSKAKL